MKVLIVDDSGFTRRRVQTFFTKHKPDFQLFEADGGQKAIEQFNDVSPDLVLLDLLMPDLPGTEVLKHIRQTPQKCFVAVVSSDIQQSTQTHVKELGANMFIEKPFTEDKLPYLMKAYDRFSNPVKKRRRR